VDGRDRVTRLLTRQPLDRVPVYEHFWEDTIKAWVTAGHVGPDETFEAHFDLDLMESYDTGWTFDLAVEAGFEPVVVEETDETQLLRDGNGALLRRHKLHDTTPEHVGFSITTPEAWAAVRPKLATVDESRIDFAGYRARRQQAAREGRFYLWSGLHVFELMRPLVGDETLLMAFALEP
jgi:uroporphyrinogen decarboxylase